MKQGLFYGVRILKKTTGILLSLFLCLSLLLPSFAEETPPPAGLSARAYCLAELDSGAVIAEKNADEKRPMASTTKIMTALLAVESGRLDEIVTVTDSDVRVEGSSLSLRAGDEMTLLDMTRGMMAVSGNDAAHTIARFLAGSDKAFAEQMNARASSLGMTSTHFTNPHGLPDEDHYSTAADMVRLTVEALRNPVFVDIVSAYKSEITYLHSVLGYTTRTVKNSNQLLNTVEGCIGVKTGYTTKAGRCLVSAVRRNGAGVVCVVLKAPDSWADSTALLEYGMTKVCHVDILTDTVEYELNVVGGTKSTVRVQNISYLSGSVTTDSLDGLETVVTLPRFAYAPVKAGDKVGEIAVYAHGERLIGIPLIAMEDAERMSTGEGMKINLLELLRNNFLWLFR